MFNCRMRANNISGVVLSSTRSFFSQTGLWEDLSYMYSRATLPYEVLLLECTRWEAPLREMTVLLGIPFGSVDIDLFISGSARSRDRRAITSLVTD